MEDYKKKYEEALGWMKSIYPTMKGVDKEDAEHYFPELKEKTELQKILEVFNMFANSYLFWEEKGINKEHALAWLEKQGKNNIGISEATKQELEDNLNKALEKETPESWNEFLDGQCEQKPADKVEPKFKVGQTIKKEGFNLGFTIAKIEDGFYYNDEGDYFPFTDQDNWKLVEQKPAWSEEDEMFVHGLIRGLAAKRDIHGHTTFSSDCIDITETINWLKSIKDRCLPQPKQEWSDVDKNILSRIIDNLMFIRDTISIDPNYAVNISDTEREITWLKSLRPHNTWKPSDEQMEALDDFIYAKYPNIEKHGAAVKSLYQDLKKLKE